jgi:hypothetical protein
VMERAEFVDGSVSFLVFAAQGIGAAQCRPATLHGISPWHFWAVGAYARALWNEGLY